MVCNQRGMALLSVVLMLSVLLVLAQVLTEKLWQSTRQTAGASHRQQLFWAAQAGIETARQTLSSSYASTGGWRTLLASATGREYPASPAWVTDINGIEVEIYLRDNADGDDDQSSDNDLKVFVLARARGRQSVDAMIESLCGFDRDATAASDPSRRAANLVGKALSEETASTYGIVN